MAINVCLKNAGRLSDNLVRQGHRIFLRIIGDGVQIIYDDPHNRRHTTLITWMEMAASSDDKVVTAEMQELLRKGE